MKRSKAILILVLVFAAGFIGGIVATRIAVRQVVRASIQHPELLRNRLEREISRRLRLDETQRARLREALAKSQTRIQGLRREFEPRFNEIVEELRIEMAPLLRPEQQQRFDEFRRENQSIFKP